MAIKSSDQISIVDVTDAYSVILTNESHTFPGTVSAAKPGSATTQVIAMQGASQVAASVAASDITKSDTNVTVSVDTDETAPTVTITVNGSVTAAGKVTIPVHINDVTINKDFTYAIAYTGTTGAKGDKGNTGDKGANAITLSITSSNGTIFKNALISTVLTAHVYQAGVEVTGTALTALGTIKWYKDSSTTATATGQTLTIGAGDVSSKASYVAQLEA